MNITIFSPVIEMSAIGMVNNMLIIALQRQGHHVTVIRSEFEEYLHLPSRVQACDVVNWNDIDKVNNLTESADLNVYHIGDNYSLHCGGVFWLARVPGIVCLHDYYLASLFYGLAHHSDKNYVKKILNFLYPDYESDKFLNALSSEEFIQATKDQAPMTEWIARMALGVIVHSYWDIQRVANVCPGFVHMQPLPNTKSISKVCDNVFLQAASSQDKFNKYKINRIMHVLTIGNANCNKRIESIIEAIGSSKNKHRIHYHVLGHATEERRECIQQVANRLNVNISLWGQTSDDVLAMAIEQADIITCLRWPALEGASASLIEALLSKRPTVVTDTGFYAELPNHVVFKIDPNNEIVELMETLDKLIYMIQHETAAIGRHVEVAYQWAAETFCVEKYANALLEAGKTIKKQQSIVKIMHYFANTLNTWNTEGLSQICLPNLEIFR